MAWFLLVVAGLLEVAWASGLKQIGDRFSASGLALTTILMFASLAALYGAMVRLPLGVAYPIWTGIGSVGSVMVSVAWFGHAISTQGMIGVALLLAGMVLLGGDAH